MTAVAEAIDRVVGERYERARIEDVVESALNPRRTFDVAKLNELAASIKEKDIVEPLVVRQLGKKLELVADSLDRVELVMAVEEQYGLVIPDGDVDRLETVGDVIAYVEAHTAPAA